MNLEYRTVWITHAVFKQLGCITHNAWRCAQIAQLSHFVSFLISSLRFSSLFSLLEIVFICIVIFTFHRQLHY